MNHLERVLVSVSLLAALIAAGGCAKKAKPLPPPEAAPAVVRPSAPTAELVATPTLISAGDQVRLTWRTTDANIISINTIGEVPTTGVKTVTPTESITYRLVAKGDGGSAEATARVTVNAPPAVQVPVSTMSTEQEFKANVQDIFFDYDTYEVRSDAQATLSHNATFLASHPNVKILIGGYCDERGSNEYNLALGQNRADSARNALITAGVAATRIRVVSYGKEKPFCSEASEECWQQIRRDGFTLDK